MEWQWIDLMPGDKIKYTDEYINFRRGSNYPGWVKWAEKTIIEVKKLKICEEVIYIGFKNWDGEYADRDVLMDGKENNITKFKIVELKED